MSTDVASPAVQRGARVCLALSFVTLVAVMSWAAVWWLAVPIPDDQICPAIAPGPPGCGAAGRQLAGWVVSGAVALACAVAAVVIVTFGRRRPWWTGAVLVALILAAVSAVVAYEDLLWSSAMADLYAKIFPFDPLGGR